MAFSYDHAEVINVKRIWAILAVTALLLTGCGQQPEQSAQPVQPEHPVVEEQPALVLTELLGDIYSAAPGTACSSLKAARAAGEFLDWSQQTDTASGDAVRQWVEENVPAENALELVLAWNEVLTQADALLRGDEIASGSLSDAGYAMRQNSYDTELVTQAALELSTLFTQMLDRTEPAPYQWEAPGDYSEVTEAAFDGAWLNRGADTLLLFSGTGCRVVDPALGWYGETAYAFRIRDRSSMGYCPALEIDFRESGNFDAPLAYYVSGIDSTHFWCSTGSESFQKLA